MKLVLTVSKRRRLQSGSSPTVLTPAFNQETAAVWFVKSKELKRENGNCVNPNLPLHRAVCLAE